MSEFDPYLHALNSNLEHYFKNKPTSRLGTSTYKDTRGSKYITFAYSVGREFIENGFPYVRDWLDNFLNGVLFATSLIKEEGDLIKQRNAVMEWRRFPTVTRDDSQFDVERFTISFRASLYNE